MTAQVSCLPIGCDFHCTKLLRTLWFSLHLGSGRRESWKVCPELEHWRESLRLGLLT